MKLARIAPLAFALMALAFHSQTATAGWNPFKDLKKEVDKAGRTLRKVGGDIERGARDVGRAAEKGVQDAGDALKDLNPQVKLRAGARLSGSSRGVATAKLYVVADVSLAGERFSVELFNGYAKKTRKSMQVRRTVKKGKFKMTITLTLSWQGNQIGISPKVKIGKLSLRVPSVRVKI